MPVSTVFIDGIGEIKIYKRRKQKNMRLRVDSSGEVKLSLPWYVSKRVGLIYVKSKKDWLLEQLNTYAKHTSQVSSIGEYKVEISYVDNKVTSVALDQKTIKMSIKSKKTEQKNLAEVSKMIEIIFRKRAETIISKKLQKIAQENKIKINSVKVKKMKGRWGSCDNKKNITLNLYLAQMPEEIWTYVLCHELSHTKFMNHSKKFWEYVEMLDQNFKYNRRILKSFSPGKLDMR